MALDSFASRYTAFSALCTRYPTVYVLLPESASIETTVQIVESVRIPDALGRRFIDTRLLSNELKGTPGLDQWS